MRRYDPAVMSRLTRINLDDVLTSLGWERVRFGRRVLEWPFLVPARLFARQVLDYDNAVAEFGLQAGSQRFLSTLLKNLQIDGQELIPKSGPVLFLSNHPGMTDTVSLFASIPRPDLRIVAADRPFLRTLPATDPLLIYVLDDPSSRMNVLRTVAAHLRSGGAVLTFPAGHIEPDPAVLPGADASLDEWSSSVGVFARMVPDVQIVPVIASGVLSPKATYHRLTHLRRLSRDRERLGATIQIMSSVFFPRLWPDLWHVSVRIRFAHPIPASEVIALRDPEKITQAVVDCIRPFMNRIVQEDSHSRNP